MVELILAVGLAMSISAACSLCEAVLYSVPLRHVETMVHQRKWSGKIFRALRRDVDKPIAAILTLNTIANTGGAAIAGSAAAAVLGQDSLGYFSAALTLGILIFSEVLPKTTGVVYGRQLVPVVALPIRWLVSALKPLVWMINRMTPRTVVFSLSEHLTCEEASTKSKRWEHSRFPVYDKNVEDIVGIVLTKELFMALARGEKDRRLTDIMRPVHFVAETARLNNVLMEFMGSTQHLSVVIDEYGGLSGVISLEDILEEILGREIMDESDQVADKRELARKRRSTLTGGQRAEGG
jgi:CBS domain containing-hemolysin-like protein